MKEEIKRESGLSLGKNTIAFLSRKSNTTSKNFNFDIDVKIPTTCGYVCGDCASGAATLVSCIPVGPFD